MKFAFKACALTVSLALPATMANAWEKDKTYNITILHTNDHHGLLWHKRPRCEYGLAAQKR